MSPDRKLLSVSIAVSLLQRSVAGVATDPLKTIQFGLILI